MRLRIGGRLAAIAISIVAVGALAALLSVAGVGPLALSTSTNTCAGCHSDTYKMYVSIDSTSVPASVGSSAVNVSVNVSVTGNEEGRTATVKSYYASDLTVSAASKDGLLTLTGSPKSYTSIKPDYTQTTTFSVTGKTSGTDTITFTAKLRPKHNPSDTTRTITASVSITVSVNVAPTLLGGGVSPASGGPDDTYTFHVTYKDANGDAPSPIRVTFDGTAHAMSPADGSADTISTGENYTWSVSGAALSEGVHSFSFSASDGKAAATGDTAAHASPTIVVDHAPTVAIAYPTGGRLGGVITVIGTASDPDAGDTVDAVLVWVGNASAATATGTGQWSLPVDLSVLPDGPLRIRAVARSGALDSPEASVNITVDNGLVNVAPSLAIGLPNGTAIPLLAWINGTVHHPEPSQGAPTVLVGVGGTAPSMAANVSGDASAWTWSILLDLSALPEGPITVGALASDPYTSSPVEQRTLVLTPPDSDPTVGFDAFAGPVWGNVTLTGVAVDPDGTVMVVTVSIGGGAAETVAVTDGRWTRPLDASALPEGEHGVAVLGSDGREEVSANGSFTVKAPVVPPVAPTLGAVEPAGPVNATVDDVVTFRARYAPGDARGIVVEWTFDGVAMNATPIDGGSELSVELLANGSHTVAVRVSHALAPELSASHAWDIHVADLPPPELPPPVDPGPSPPPGPTDPPDPSPAPGPPDPPGPPPPPDPTVPPDPSPPPSVPAFELAAVGPADVETVVGSVVLLRFEVVDGTATSVRWTVDGEPVAGSSYLAYMPGRQGLHVVEVAAGDRLGRTATLAFRVWAAAPPVPEAAQAPPDPVGPGGISPLGAAAIGALSTLVVVSAAWAIGRTRDAHERARSQAASRRGKGAERGADARAPARPAPAKASGARRSGAAGATAAARPVAVAPTARMVAGARPVPLAPTSRATADARQVPAGRPKGAPPAIAVAAARPPRPPHPSEPCTPIIPDRPPARAPAGPRTPSAPFWAPRRTAIEVAPLPVVRPCMVCGGREVYNQAWGRYWCYTCYAFHPVEEPRGARVQWSDGVAR